MSKQANLLDFFKFSNQEKRKRSQIQQTPEQEIQKQLQQEEQQQNNAKMQVEDDQNMPNSVQTIHVRKKNKLQIDSDSEGEKVFIDKEVLNNGLDKIMNKDKSSTKMEEEKFLDNTQQKESKPLQNNKRKTNKASKKDDNSDGSDGEKQIAKPKKKTQQTPSFGGKKDNTEFINVNKENQVENAEIEDFQDRTPYWATPQHLRDANMRKITDPGYDPTTLYIPDDEFDKLTNAMKQYWTFKKENFDKVIFFKLGKFYELFYEDALIGNKYLDLNWMGKKMHTGFPEKVLDKYGSILVDLGFKICVIEQMETPKQMQERIKGQKGAAKCVTREITQVLTKGTFTSQDVEYQPRYLLAVRNMGNQYGICIVDVSTSVVTMGCIDDDENLSMFKTLLCQIKPAEIIYDPMNVTPIMLQIFKKGFFKPVLSQITNNSNEWHQGTAFNMLENVHGDMEQKNWPQTLLHILEDQNKDLTYSCLAGLFSYLKKILIIDDILQTARYNIYDLKQGIRNSMILDSQALQHLEILETTLDPAKPQLGSLISFIDKTCTPFSKRMLQNMVCAPLLDINQINSRLDAIEDIHEIQVEVQAIRNQLTKFPDIPRQLSQIYKYSHQSTKKAIFFEDIPVKNLKIFNTVLQNLQKAGEILKKLAVNCPNFKSQRLIRLLTPQKDMQDEDTLDDDFLIYQGQSQRTDGLLPPLNHHLSDFLRCIEWTGKNKEVPIPVKGIVVSYDQARETVQEVKQRLQEVLERERKEMKDRTIQFVDIKYRYELEVPEKIVKGNAKPDRYEFTSSKNGFQRFHTREIKELIEELEQAEEIEKTALVEFVQFIFKQFQAKYKIWDQTINILAELDCYFSLSLVSFNAGGVMCRPQIEYVADGESFLDIQHAWHPCLQMTGVNFIPNDVRLGKWKENSDQNKTCLLLTGPNMGGKSTLLRMSCIIPILAQMGCYVPAFSCRMSVVDRIFTRLGASDRLVEGKSTFFIEMEETSNAVKNATANSLIIMDELGRGTSTFDGVAIAYSILKYLVESIKCRCMFATHYHILLDEFRNYEQIEYGHMACVVNEKTEKVIFLYKLKEGECSSSFGINVARVVGIEQSILQTAQQQAQLFEQELKGKKYVQVQKQFNQVLNTLFNNNEINFNNDDDILNTISKLEMSFQEDLQIKTPVRD